jgi:multiple sugar transport system ATP-binding protein
MAEVSLRKVTKVFGGGIVAVKDFTLDVADREFVVLVGPSGCGKTTTLRMIAGLEEVTSGEIYIDGKLVNDLPPKDRDIAMVFQNYALYPHMTVYDNIAFGLKLRKYPKQEIEKRVREAAEILGISHLLDRKPRALSGGERQRVAVGRAIVRNPKAFLFDEPLSNLDAKQRVEMRAEISKLHQRLGATVIYVTHDQVEAMSMGDRIVVMDKGVIQQVADPITLYSKPANRFVAGFIGSPPMNFFDGIIAKGESGYFFVEKEKRFSLLIPWDQVPAISKYEGKEITFGIRPENISLKEIPWAGKMKAEGIIEVLEPMGAEAFIYVNIKGISLIVREEEYEGLLVGQKVDLFFEMTKAHFFDKKSELRVN